MSTTELHRIYPDFFKSNEEARERREQKQTNPRYKGFSQTHFTAGDEDQFDQYRYWCGSNIRQSATLTSSNLWRKYQDLSPQDTLNTFRYMFHKFKKGIFVKIKDGELKVFLPFSKANYYNEWSSQIDTTGFMDLAKRVTEGEGYMFKPKRINQNVEEWYGNNCLMRYEFPLSEGDTNVDNVRNMLAELCEERKIPDVEFFINRRDFPLLKKDGTEPYEEIWGPQKPLVSHSYDKYMPILSMATSDRFADIAIPNHNDWARIQSKDSKWFPASTSGNFDDDFNTFGWDDKIETAIFRGASTGKGVTIETNPRLKASWLSHRQETQTTTPPLLDAGITSWNLRMRKLDGCRRLRTIDYPNLPFGKMPFMAFAEQAHYKYILHIAGHVSAFRLSMELATRSVVLKVKSEWKVWYESDLVEYVHYVPIKEDLSDLLDQIEWCRLNDGKCKQISINARSFYDQRLCRDGVMDSLETLFTDLAVHTPVYPRKSDLDHMIEYERASMSIATQYTAAHIQGRRTLIGIDEITSRDLSDIAVDKGVIFSNKLSKITKWVRNTKEPGFVVKSTPDDRKMNEYVHEAYIGRHVTNLLAQDIPNFAHVFGLTKNDEVAVEFIEGVTLYEYINSEEFRFDKFKKILIQIALAIRMAHYLYGFIHYDLTPWNIILYKDPIGSLTINYETGPGKFTKISSETIPVIIDFGKSKAVVYEVNRGFVNPTSNSSIQDIVTLILTSCKTILATRRSPDQFTQTMHLFNFLAGNRYLPKPVKSSFEIKAFLKRHGKYEQLISDDKFELEKLNALDFVKYLGGRV
jgi:hypothetical protein